MTKELKDKLVKEKAFSVISVIENLESEIEWLKHENKCLQLSNKELLNKEIGDLLKIMFLQFMALFFLSLLFYWMGDKTKKDGWNIVGEITSILAIVLGVSIFIVRLTSLFI